MAKAKIKKFDSNDIFKIFRDNDFNALREFIKDNGIDAVDRDGRNILLNCIIENKTDWALDIIKNTKELDINSQDKGGFSALHFAVQEHNLKILTALLKKKHIIIDIQDKYGNTPLMRAFFVNENKEDIIIKLLEAGADINKKNNYNVTPGCLYFIEKTMVKINNYIQKNNIELDMETINAYLNYKNEPPRRRAAGYLVSAT
jgi:ankyrin repeat protein